MAEMPSDHMMMRDRLKDLLGDADGVNDFMLSGSQTRTSRFCGSYKQSLTT